MDAICSILSVMTTPPSRLLSGQNGRKFLCWTRLAVFKVSIFKGQHIKIYEEAKSLVQKMTLTPHHVIAGEGRVSLKVPSAKRDEWRWVVVALKNVSSSSMNLETCKPPRLRSSYNLAFAKLEVVHLM